MGLSWKYTNEFIETQSRKKDLELTNNINNARVHPTIDSLSYFFHKMSFFFLRQMPLPDLVV